MENGKVANYAMWDNLKPLDMIYPFGWYAE